MGYIHFDKNQLINLKYALSKEMIRSSRSGAYACTTIINSNTRKYHGLLVVPQKLLDNELHVLLSSLDETVIQHNAEFNLGIHKYPGGIYSPKGHKYLRDFESDPIPMLIYRVGDVVLKKEILFSHNNVRLLIRYTLLDVNTPTTLRFRPLLAFRNRHQLSKANLDATTGFDPVINGIMMQIYRGYTPICMQFSKEVEYTHVPDWYYNIEYQEEQERGYAYQEDLLVPGYFEVQMERGESIVFAAGINEVKPRGLSKSFNDEMRYRIPRNSFDNCLINSAQQFIVKQGKHTEVVAGYPWFGRWGRDTFISLTGLTLELEDSVTCRAVIDTMLSELKGPLFPNVGSGSETALNSVDASLWFFRALQDYTIYTRRQEKIWGDYGKKIKMIIDGFIAGTHFNIAMDSDGLIYAGEKGVALTWMDAVVDGTPVTPRTGKAVEINALWYNALRFSIEMAEIGKDEKYAAKLHEIVSRIEQSFVETFWNSQQNCLYDYVDGDYRDDAIRPNQVFAAALPYSLLSEEQIKSVLDVIKAELLTPRGLRTLSPQHPAYKGTYYGDQGQRDSAYHQGTVWPWLLGAFAEAWLKVYGKDGKAFITKLYHGFEPVMHEHGIGSVSEIYDGNPPHTPRGAISQAWSVAELLRIRGMLQRV